MNRFTFLLLFNLATWAVLFDVFPFFPARLNAHVIKGTMFFFGLPLAWPALIFANSAPDGVTVFVNAFFWARSVDLLWKTLSEKPNEFDAER